MSMGTDTKEFGNHFKNQHGVIASGFATTNEEMQKAGEKELCDALMEHYGLPDNVAIHIKGGEMVLDAFVYDEHGVVVPGKLESFSIGTPRLEKDPYQFDKWVDQDILKILFREEMRTYKDRALQNALIEHYGLPKDAQVHIAGGVMAILTVEMPTKDGAIAVDQMNLGFCSTVSDPYDFDSWVNKETLKEVYPEEMAKYEAETTKGETAGEGGIEVSDASDSFGER